MEYRVIQRKYDPSGRVIGMDIQQFTTREAAFDRYSELCDIYLLPCHVGLISLKSGGIIEGVEVELTTSGEGEE